jgi:conjugal transfer pilus assembly protein TraW
MRCSEHLCQPRRLLLRPGRMALVAVAVLLSLAHARDLGVIGPVYPIAEPSLLEVILAKLRDAEANGVLARLQRDAQARAKHADRAARCRSSSSRRPPRRAASHYDPSIVVPYAISMPMARSSSRPARRSIRSTPCRSRKRCSSSMRATPRRSNAPANSRRARGQVKVILTGGSYLDLMRRWKRPVFFDQQVTSPRSSASATCPRSSPRTARGCASMNSCSSALTRLRRGSSPPRGAGLWLAGPAVAAGPTCHGRFMNPITDICWSCMFPLTIGSASLLSRTAKTRHRQSVLAGLLSAATHRASA